MMGRVTLWCILALTLAILVLGGRNNVHSAWQVNATQKYPLISSSLSQQFSAPDGDGEEEEEASSEPELDYVDLFGVCPLDNAVCVAIRFRNPKDADDCEEHSPDKCGQVGSRLTRDLQPGEDEKFPDGCGRCVEMDDEDDTDEKGHWAYDVIFGYDKEGSPEERRALGYDPKWGTVSNTDVYKAVVRPSMDQAFGCEKPKGVCQSAAFFAYGASGSGKSYTMGFERGKKDGLMQLGVEKMFESLANLKEMNHPLGSQKVFMAYYELYGADAGGSKVYDLLGRSKKKGKGKKGSRDIVLCSLNFREVTNLEHMMEVFSEGNDKREVGGTGMNSVSSRSHAAAQFFLSDKPIAEMSAKIQGGDRSGRSKLLAHLKESVQIMFVDLAGSEPASKWDDPVRQAEGKTINLALTALRMCIAATANPRATKCSTRSDMLTEMLKGLFEKDRKGNAKSFTRMIATFNPSADPSQIALSKGTMEYASTVKSIKIESPTGKSAGNVVRITPQMQITQLKAQLAELEEANKKYQIEIEELKKIGGGDGSDPAQGDDSNLDAESGEDGASDAPGADAGRIAELEEANRKLQDEIDALSQNGGGSSDASSECSELKAENQRLLDQIEALDQDGVPAGDASAECEAELKKLHDQLDALSQEEDGSGAEGSGENSAELETGHCHKLRTEIERLSHELENRGNAAELESPKLRAEIKRLSDELENQKLRALQASQAAEEALAKERQAREASMQKSASDMKRLTDELENEKLIALQAKQKAEEELAKERQALEDSKQQFVECDDELDACEDLESEASSALRLVRMEEKECRKQLDGALQEVQECKDKGVADIDAVIQARREETCELFGLGDQALSVWEEDDTAQDAFSDLSRLNKKQAKRSRFIQKLEGKQARGEWVGVGWLGEKVADLMDDPKSLGTFQVFTMGLDEALTLLRREMAQVKLTQDMYFFQGIQALNKFKTTVDDWEPHGSESKVFKSVQYGLQRSISDTSSQMSRSHEWGVLNWRPESELTGLDVTIRRELCTGLTSLWSQAVRYGGECDVSEESHFKDDCADYVEDDV